MEYLDRLIYSDHSGKELGILQGFEIDLDVAKGKDFKLTMSADRKMLDAGFYWHMQGEEWGGIVDRIDGDTTADQIVYYGRNCRGILASKIFYTSSNVNLLSGYPHEIMQEILQHVGLTSLYTADTDTDADASSRLFSLAVPSYISAYDAMIAVADAVNCGLKFSYSSIDRKWHISTALKVDHSEYLNYCRENSIGYRTSNQVNAVNHLIVRAPDTGRIIHLFTDKGGNVQKYAKVSTPLEDADYILDESQKKMTGADEYAQCMEVQSGETANYKMLGSQPRKWNTNFSRYFYRDATSEAESFKQYEWYTTGEKVYRLLTAQPSDWSTNYASYFKKVPTQTSYEYQSVSGVTTDRFYALGSKRPNDWATNYGSYYTRMHDGVRYIYEAVEASTKTKYTPQTVKPSDWANNYANYYCIGEKYVKLSGSAAPTFRPNVYFKKFGENFVAIPVKPKDWSTSFRKYYEMRSVYMEVEGVKQKKATVAPQWRKNRFYIKETTSYAPAWANNTYFYNAPTTSAPAWQSNAYYIEESVEKVPTYIAGNCYEEVIDHYGQMVESGLQKLEELKASQSQELSLDDFEVAIGDIVGGVDDITGYMMCEPVSNIIARLDRYGVTLSYEIGGV